MTPNTVALSYGRFLGFSNQLKSQPTTSFGVPLRCSGRITSSTSDILRVKLRSLIPETKCVVLDLTDVNYVDSSGLGALVSVYVSAKRRYCQLKLINLTQRLKKLFRITRLAAIFEGHEELLGLTPD